MIEYKAIYDENYNKIIGYKLNSSFIPIAKGNKDYMEMLELLQKNEAKIIELTEEEKQAKREEIENNKKIEEAKRYLKETDWVSDKLNDYIVLNKLGLLDKSLEEQYNKYIVILKEREEKRKLINELENNK